MGGKTILSKVSPLQEVFLSFALVLTLVWLLARPFFPIDGLWLGHDYSLALTWLMDGKFWSARNGLSVPWFTPSFCAGQPFFPDPQSFFYSLPQALAHLFSPVDTFFVLLLATIALVFCGSYRLARDVFQMNVHFALMAAVVMALNGFLFHRLIIGHVTFHGFALVPVLAWLLAVPTTTRYGNFVNALTAGVALAYWVHSGLSTLILPATLSVLALLAMAVIAGQPESRMIFRGMVATFVGTGLSASKLVAIGSYLSNFPRSDYLLPGAGSAWDTLYLAGVVLTLPAQWASQVGMPLLRNLQWHLSPHEWSYNFSVSAILLSVAALVVLAKRFGKRPIDSVSFRGIVLLGFVMAIPLAVNFYSPPWQALLKALPIIKSTSSPLRWMVIYVPIFGIGLPYLCDKAFGNTEKAKTAVYIVIALAFAKTILEPRDYFFNQRYLAAPMQMADRMLRAGKLIPEITELDTEAEIIVGDLTMRLNKNDPFIAGVSSVDCYNPVFGYRLEKLNLQGLSSGSVLPEGSPPNLKNPVCYVFPKENNCLPGEQFSASSRASIERFIRYQSFEFARSNAQYIAEHVTRIFLFIVAAFWLAALLRRVTRRTPESK